VQVRFAIFDRLGDAPDAIELHTAVSAKSAQHGLNQSDLARFLMTAFLGLHCTPITELARRSRPAELLLSIGRAEEMAATPNRTRSSPS
jgi:hypothetical protein